MMMRSSAKLVAAVACMALTSCQRYPRRVASRLDRRAFRKAPRFPLRGRRSGRTARCLAAAEATELGTAAYLVRHFNRRVPFAERVWCKGDGVEREDKRWQNTSRRCNIDDPLERVLIAHSLEKRPLRGRTL
jgi:hypothetical protein